MQLFTQTTTGGISDLNYLQLTDQIAVFHLATQSLGQIIGF